MKKILVIICVLAILPLSFAGCNYDLGNLNFNKTKPNNFYYTNILAKNLTLESTCKSTIIDTNFFKEKELSQENIDYIRSLVKNLNKNNFISQPKDLPSKPAYKIVLEFSKDKLLINVYNEKYIAIYPWDGNYPMDYIDLTNIPVSLNLYNLGKFIFN